MTASSPAFGDGWDIYGIARLPDPHRAWRQLRERAPVFDAGGGVFLITRWDLVERVLRDPGLAAGRGVTESFGVRSGRLYDVSTSWLMALDGAAHTRVRGLVSRAFTPRRVAALEGPIRDAARELAGRVLEAAGRRPTDLVRGLALALPSEVIRGLFAIEREDWSEQVEPLFRGGESGPGAAAAIEALAEYFTARLRDGTASEGLLGQLRAADAEHGALSELEVIANAVLLVTAAIDTTAGLISNTVLCLLRQPRVLAGVRREPETIPAAIEETLRFEPPALSCSRYAARPLELGGVEIPAGSQLLLGLAAANRDPARYPDPDRFDPSRDHAGGLSFGGGRHFCMGAALARLEARLALEALLSNSAPALELASEVTWRGDNPTIRAPRELWVRAA